MCNISDIEHHLDISDAALAPAAVEFDLLTAKLEAIEPIVITEADLMDDRQIAYNNLVYAT